MNSYAGAVNNCGAGSPNLFLQIESTACSCDDLNAATLGSCQCSSLQLLFAFIGVA
jgi:hypothetical protein